MNTILYIAKINYLLTLELYYATIALIIFCFILYSFIKNKTYTWKDQKTGVAIIFGIIIAIIIMDLLRVNGGAG